MTYENIEGWFSWQCIYDDWAKNCPHGGIIVELGVWKGKSASYLASKIKEYKRELSFYAVDRFDGNINNDTKISNVCLLEEFKQNMANC